MAKPVHNFKVGQCLRFRRRLIAAFSGARAMAYKQTASLRKALGIPDYDPNPPEYHYVRLTHVSDKELIGTDFITFESRGFKFVGAKWESFDPADPKDIMDFWGYDEIIELTPADVRALTLKRLKKFRDIAQNADQIAREYGEKRKQLLSSL